jgi:hypothetical protein
MTGVLYLEHIGNFEIKGKIYGSHNRNRDRILETFFDRPASTGVMLTGEKGSGKSLLARDISIEGYKKGIPTIVINTPLCGDRFNSFIQTIEQPCIVLFDEFEKVYPSEEQEQLLTLLDGVFPTKKLFLLTCNDAWRIDKHMQNRPGRIYYMISFKGLSREDIIEYCQDHLINKTYIERIVQVVAIFNQFNFDMLKALIEEMNRYDEAPEISLQILNVNPNFDRGNKFTIALTFNGIKIEKHDKTWDGNPLGKNIYISYCSIIDEPPVNDDSLMELILDSTDDSDGEWNQLSFNNENLKKIENNGTEFIFYKDGFVLKLTKTISKEIDYLHAF